MSRALHLVLDIGLPLSGAAPGDSAPTVDPGPTSDPEPTLDPGLRGLLTFCRAQSITATIFCADPDNVLRPALHHSGWDDVRVVTGTRSWLPVDGDAALQEHEIFPYVNTECDQCARCRRNLMLGSAGDGDVLMYAGDGDGDPCPAEYADMVFARGRLQTWCQQQNITHFVFRSLNDLHRRLVSECRNRSLRPRPRAERKRREAYLVEA